MADRMLDPAIRRSANESWYVSGRASQRDRYARCLAMLAARVPQQGVVYDLGTGTGHFARLLAERFRRVVGIERLPKRVAQCRAEGGDVPGLTFIDADVLDLDMPSASADAVCALEMLYYVEPSQWDRLLDQVHAMLRPGGRLLVSLNTFSPDGEDGEEKLRRVLEPRFDIVDVQHMHRGLYYRLELPLIRLLDEITYLESVKVFYPHTLAVEHVVYSALLDRLLLPPSWILDRIALPGLRRFALAALGSDLLYRLVTAVSRRLAPMASRTQVLVLARRPLPQTGEDAAEDRHGATHPG